MSRITIAIAGIFCLAAPALAMMVARSLRPPDTVQVAIQGMVATPEISAALGSGGSPAALEILLKGRSSLSNGLELPDLNLSISDNELHYSTNASYYPTDPECFGQDSLDFQIAASASFGMRAYVFGDECPALTLGDDTTAFYASASDPGQNLLAFSAPGRGLIYFYELDTLEFLYSFPGFSATSMTFHGGDLFFVAYPLGADWENGSVYKYSTSKRKIVAVHMRHMLADGRGISFSPTGEVAVSDGSRNRVIIANSYFKPETIIEGFSYPNGVSFTNSGDLLVADEHHGRVVRLAADTWSVAWLSPENQLMSPGSAVEIDRGTHAGSLLIADADGSRVLVVDPTDWTISFEAANIRSPMSAVPIYGSSQPRG